MDDPTERGGRRSRYLWIRNNIVGLVALFVALSGTAVAAQVATNAGHGGAVKAAKKKKKKRGPQGPPGANGVNGTNGPAGPTFGAEAFSDAGTTPSASQATLSSGSVTTPAAGALYVFGHLNAGTNPTCGSGGPATYALYVDGAGVPGTAVTVSTAQQPTLAGIIDGIPAGTHEISIGLACVGGSVATTGAASHSAGAILLG